MRKFRLFFISLFSLILFMSVFLQDVSSQNNDFSTDFDLSIFNEQNQKKAKNDSKREIKKLIHRMTKYVNSCNANGIEQLLSDSYVNNDGFDKKSYIETVKDFWTLYPGMKHSVKIKSIHVNGDWAKVLISSELVGRLSSSLNDIEKDGVIKSVSDSVLFLNRYGAEWKIQSEFMTNEKLVLAYSDAQLLDINLTSSPLVAQNSEYNAKLNVVAPQRFVIFASVDNGELENPKKIENVTFKTLAHDGTLERIVRANAEGKNEFLLSSIVVTEPSVSKDSEITIKIKGVAYIMSRVNVVSSSKRDSEQI